MATERNDMMTQIVDLLQNPNRSDRYIRRTRDGYYTTDAEAYMGEHDIRDHYVHVPQWYDLPADVDLEPDAERLLNELDEEIERCGLCNNVS